MDRGKVIKAALVFLAGFLLGLSLVYALVDRGGK